jgi:hypothetical protein
VGIVADFLEHFESQKDRLDSLSIINGALRVSSLISGFALKHASRAPSLAKLAKEEQARFAESIVASIASDPQARQSPMTSEEYQSLFPAPSPALLISQRRRLGSLDASVKSPASPHTCLFRAFSLASFSGNYERVDGFPYLSFASGQVFFPCRQC